MDISPAPSLGPTHPVRAPMSRLTRARAFIAARHWTFFAGTLIFLAVVLMVILAPLVAPYPPGAQDLLSRLQPPNHEHWLGTDHLGRDVFSRVLVGGQFSVIIAAISVVLSVVVGTLIGVLSGRIGGLFDELVMRTVDLLISVPDVVIAIFLVAVFGPGYVTLVISLTIVGWTPYARLARGLSMSINAQEFIRAAEVLGSTRRFVIFRHIIPNTVRPIAAVSFLRFGHKLITVGSLSFLGLGVQPPQPDWALMLADAQPYLERAPLLMIAPGIMIFLAALSVTWVGHGLDIDTREPGEH
ncbi:ABC transporter permease [Pelagibacterium sp.]|uniref:ABC transporter permease n=1 Tax=Pelagibacterium sp. TaxID=1967288 RepID=UPI003BAA92B3